MWGNAACTQYHGPMTEIVLGEGGTVDKDLGDAVVSIVAAPLAQPDPAVRAGWSGLRRSHCLDELPPTCVARSWPEAHEVIGPNAGVAIVEPLGLRREVDAVTDRRDQMSSHGPQAYSARRSNCVTSGCDDGRR